MLLGKQNYLLYCTELIQSVITISKSKNEIYAYKFNRHAKDINGICYDDSFEII